jgi:hypothetical protein
MTRKDPKTEELRVAQLKRESAERERAGRGVSEYDTQQHERRAAKAAYLREKLEERARAEREAGVDE